MRLIDDLKWRYAAKQYDSSKVVSDEHMETIKEAIQLSATSYGLQLFKVIQVVSPEIREKLKPATWNQPQSTDASHLLVFCTYEDVTDALIDSFVELKSRVQNVPMDALSGYSDFIKSKMSEQSLDSKQVWMAKQTYIGLANAMSAAAELRIDTTPMEGFEREAYDEILGLKEKGLKSAVVLAVGYRSDEDQTQNAPKVRRSMDDLFETM